MNNYLSRAGKTILIMEVVAGSITYVHGLNKDAHSPSTGQTSIAQVELPQSPVQSEFEDLLDAIEWVESRGDPNAVSDGGRAIGAYQIWKIYVRDANRILGWDKYTHEDRWYRDKSRELTAIVSQHYGRNKSFDGMARIHHAGPDGWRTEPEWF